MEHFEVLQLTCGNTYKGEGRRQEANTTGSAESKMLGILYDVSLEGFRSAILSIRCELRLKGVGNLPLVGTQNSVTEQLYYLRKGKVG